MSGLQRGFDVRAALAGSSRMPGALGVSLCEPSAGVPGLPCKACFSPASQVRLQPRFPLPLFNRLEGRDKTLAYLAAGGCR